MNHERTLRALLETRLTLKDERAPVFVVTYSALLSLLVQVLPLHRHPARRAFAHQPKQPAGGGSERAGPHRQPHQLHHRLLCQAAILRCAPKGLGFFGAGLGWAEHEPAGERESMVTRADWCPCGGAGVNRDTRNLLYGRGGGACEIGFRAGGCHSERVSMGDSDGAGGVGGRGDHLSAHVPALDTLLGRR
jgi:hypothetical protein